MLLITLDNKEASNLLVSIFNWLDSYSIKYCIERNYDGYPEKITGDIDILVSDVELKEVSEGIKNISTMFKIVKQLPRINQTLAI